MELFIILTLIGLGLALIVAEIVFIPGITVVGLLGAGMVIAGIWISFRSFGPEVGWLTGTGSVIASGIVLYLSFRARVWSRFSLRSAIRSTVNEGELATLKAGLEGTALSALRPFGKGEWDNKSYEVRTLGQYVEPGTKIRIIKILNNQIIVEPIP